MKKIYLTPSLDLLQMQFEDVITASTGKESVSFDLDWVSGSTGGDVE